MPLPAGAAPGTEVRLCRWQELCISSAHTQEHLSEADEDTRLTCYHMFQSVEGLLIHMLRGRNKRITLHDPDRSVVSKAGSPMPDVCSLAILNKHSLSDCLQCSLIYDSAI